MIASLRRAHRRLWIALAVLLPTGFGLALAARPDAPLQAAWPDALASESLPAGAALRTSTRMQDGRGLLAELHAMPQGAAPRFVVRALGELVSEPDVLLYGAPSEMAEPAQWILLGALAGARPLWIDEDAGPWLVAWSLARQERLVALSLEAD